MRATVLLILLSSALAAGDASAECKPAGAVLYRERRQAVGEATPTWTTRVEVRASGWFQAGAGAARTTGCLAPARRAELRRALAAARFGLDRSQPTCAALPTERVRYQAPSRRRSVDTEAPCGSPLDGSTGRLVACVDALVRDAPDAELRATCRARP